jgi:exopolyphosphatase / guanosine-5'-triphosphate,3'-diphosphate pyrophosphatase
MENPERSNTYAAVDLGSNSFHLLVARREHGELRVLDRIKDMVRLGGGLDAEGRLDPAVRDRAFASLARFGQRLRGIPQDNLRAVGTQTFRRMKNANAFLMIAETALGCGIDIIAGREEARLIYLGVTQGVAGHEDRRLVIDIGGGSTELVIGEGMRPLEMESLQYGCVSLTRRFFGDGKLSRKRWKKALEFGPGRPAGAAPALPRHGLGHRDRLLRNHPGGRGNLPAPGLGRTRHPMPRRCCGCATGCCSSGPSTPCACPACRSAADRCSPAAWSCCRPASKRWRSKVLRVSPYALREGVLTDMLGRLEHRDPRDKTVEAFMSRYSVDGDQVGRVKRTALTAFDRIAGQLQLRPIHRQLLGWAADLHETGLGVSHSQYQLHSGYLVEHSDMAGFTRQEQLFLAALVRHHRRAIPRGFTDRLPTRLHEPLRMTLLCLRLAAVLCRSRDNAAIPAFSLGVSGNTVATGIPADWLESHPLTVFDLQQEARDLKVTGLLLRLEAVAP